MYISRLSAAFTKRIRGIVPALNITLAAGFAAGAISGLFYIFDLVLISIVFFVLVYQVENLRLPAGISWFADNVNTDVLATALSVESQGKSIITAILALGMGLLADHFGPGSALLVISVLMLVLWPLLKIGKSR